MSVTLTGHSCCQLDGTMRGGLNCPMGRASLHSSALELRLWMVPCSPVRWRKSCSQRNCDQLRVSLYPVLLIPHGCRNFKLFYSLNTQLNSSLMDERLSSCWNLCSKTGSAEVGLRKFGKIVTTTGGVQCKYSRGFKKVGSRVKRSKLEERILKGFKNIGLEAQYNSLPQWSGAVPYVVAGLETLLMVGWATGLGGRTLGYFSGEGVLIVMLGFNFVIGWLASQVSTWRAKALSPYLLSRERRGKTKPGFFDFFVSFWVNFIPLGNFLAWLRISLKEGKFESAVNALVYVVPSLFRLLLWTQGLSLSRVEQFAWLLGAIHRPYDAARLRNERLIAAALERQRESHEKEKENQMPDELTVEELAFIQRRRELEDFDIQLARSTNSTSTIPGSPEDWSVGDVLQWLAVQGFARYASNFADNDVDGAILMQLTADDLRDELGIQSFGDRKKLEKTIERLKSEHGR